MKLEYGDWRIVYNPKAVKTADWEYWHIDFDDAPDAVEYRCGAAATFEKAINEILFLIAEDSENGLDYELFGYNPVDDFPALKRG